MARSAGSRPEVRSVWRCRPPIPPRAAGARRNGGAHQRRRYQRDRRQRPLSERWNRIPDAEAERDSHQRSPASSRRLAQHLLEAATARRVRLSCPLRGGCGEVRRWRDGRRSTAGVGSGLVAAGGNIGGSRDARRSAADDGIARAAEIAAKPAKPMDNTDFNLLWRKRVVREFVTYALRELRGDDMRELRWKLSRQS